MNISSSAESRIPARNLVSGLTSPGKRRQEQCSYTRNTKPSSLSSPDSSGLDQANGVPSSIHLKQLELMHQYSTSTYHTVALQQGALRLHGPIGYQIDIPRLALENDYLLDCIYALTSLHFAHLRPTESHTYLQDAARYHTRSLAACREGLTMLDAPNAIALYYTSALLGIVHLAFRAVDPNNAASQKPSDTLAQMSVMWRGTYSVILATKEVVSPEDYNALFPPPTWDMRNGSPLGTQSRVFFERLRDRANMESQSPIPLDQNGSISPCRETSMTDRRSVYLETIEMVQALLNAHDLEHSRVLAWLVICPSPFMDLLAQQDPLASAIVLMYSVAMRNMDEFWWAKNLRRDLVDELAPIVAACDPEMAELVSWVESWTVRPDAMAPIHTSNWAESRARRPSAISKTDESSAIVHTPSWADKVPCGVSSAEVS